MRKIFFVALVYFFIVTPVILLSQDILENMRPISVGGNWGRTPLWIMEQPADYYDFLKNISVNWAGIAVGVHIDNSLDTTLERIYDNIPLETFREEPLRDLIRGLENNKLKTYLSLAIVTEAAAQSSKPVHRWMLGDPDIPDSNPEIKQEDWPWDTEHPDHQQFVNAFWESYTEQAVFYAKICEDEGVDIFAIGAELDRLFRSRAGGRFTNHFKDYIVAMVDSVRKYYSGIITYEQHWSALTDLDLQPGADHLFEDTGMDIVGVSAYFKLTETQPNRVWSVDEFEAAWTNIFNTYLEPLQNRNPGKEILFLEFGYNDHIGSPFFSVIDEFSNKVFLDNNQNGLDDGEEQQSNNYEAFLNINEQHNRLVKGAFLWGHDLCSNDDWNSTFGQMVTTSIRNKLAEDVVRQWYTEYTPLPDVPVLVSPADGTGGLPLEVTLKWDEPVEAVTYELQLSYQPDFSQLELSLLGISETPYLLIGLQGNKTYYWRIRAKNAKGESDWSQPYSFSTYALPSTPLLDYPANGAVDLLASVELRWLPSDNAEKYDVRVSDNQSMSPIVFSFVDLQDTNVLLEGLNNSFTYYWYVGAKNVHGMSAWSEVFSFSTYALPAVPLLEFPENGAQNLPVELELRWGTASNADNYDVEISENDSFNPVEIFIQNVVETNIRIKDLKNLQTYYWHVKGKNEFAHGEWSETYSFITGQLVGISNLNNLPTEFSLSQNYPNPFNPGTIIEYGLPFNSNVKLEVYNILGKRVAVLVNKEQSAGIKSISWDASKYANGVYMVRLIAEPLTNKSNKFRSIKKMLLLK